MRAAGEVIQPHVRRVDVEIAPARVGVQQRPTLHPILVAGIRFDDLGARVRQRAAHDASVDVVRHRIERQLPREREQPFRRPAPDVLAMRELAPEGGTA